jgi:hypothetical protein
LAEDESDGPELPPTSKKLSAAIVLLFISVVAAILAACCFILPPTHGGAGMCMAFLALLLFAGFGAAGLAALRSWHESRMKESPQDSGDSTPNLSQRQFRPVERLHLVHDPAYERYLERRAEQQGLPTDPEAYQEGELALLTTAYGVQEAELLVALLRGSDIPAWIEGEHMASWNWHMQLGLNPRGIRIVVPGGRIEDARAALEEHRKAGDELRDQEPPEPSEHGPDYQLYRSAQRLGYLLITGIFDPIAFFLAIRLLRKIRRRMREVGPTADLERARRMAWGIILLAWPLWILLFGAGSAIVAAF